MAIENAKTLNVRIRNKYDSYENWASSSLVLEAGEIAIAYTTVNVDIGNGKIEQHPELLMKVGDGSKTFANLPWLSAKAADVAAWAKAANKPVYEAREITGIGDYIATYVDETLGISVDTDTQYQIVKVDDYNYKLQSKGKGDEAWADVANSAIVIPNDTAAIEALQALVGDKKVATQISEAIANLDLANTYEAKGEAAKVQTALDTYKTSNDAAVQKNATDIAGEISRAKAAEEANANAITAIKDGTTIDSFADVETALAGKEASGAAAQALTDAKAYADGLAGNYDEKGAAATAESNAKAYADGLAVNYDKAGDAAQALTDAKAYTDAEITEWVGGTKVSEQIENAITGANLGQYETKTDATAKLTEAKTYADGLNTAMDTRVKAVEGKAHEHTNKDLLDTYTQSEVDLADAVAKKHEHANAAELAKIADGDVAKWNAAEQNAKDYADGLDGAMDTRVQALEAKFGDGEGNVEAQIAAAVAAEKEAREAADKVLQDQIGVASAEGVEATGLNKRLEELEDLVGDKKVSEAIAAEATAREEADTALGNRVKAIEDTYATDSDVADLQTQINTIMNNPDTEGVINSINEFTQYIADHGEIADGFRADIDQNKEDIAANAKAIEDHEALAAETYATKDELAAEKLALQGEIDADVKVVADRVTTLENDLNTETTGLKARMTAAESDINALETKVGDETVAAQIEAAIEALKIGDYAKAADLTTAIARIAQNETDIAALEGRMDTAEEEIAKKANDADLAAIAKTGSTDDLIQGEMTIVFDCGSSAV